MFLTFEGIEGSGKSTQIRRLSAHLHTCGVDVVLTREPGGTDIGRALRRVLLSTEGEPPHPSTELLLYAADRAQHLSEVIEPALERGAVVLCDRYLDATLAYQGYGRELGVDRVLELHAAPPLDRRPDRTLLIDLDPEDGIARARARNRDLGLEAEEGRFEAEQIRFHQKVRAGYLELAGAEPGRFRLISGDGTEEEVEARVLSAVTDLWPSLREISR
ncbi:hypothetical protein ABI59_05015 [Acidobacteria bacterium Mor1]|nr:hypothetical protein ABI59_05015 [Acidobacteria bacterium Mor1]